MTGALLLALLLAPGSAREPVGRLDAERVEDPLEARVTSLLAGEPVLCGIAAFVPLYARVPSEAGDGRPAEVAWAGSGLRARFLVEDGRSYLRVVNPAKGAVLLAAGTVFGAQAFEVATTRDAVIPGEYAALLPAAALGGAEAQQVSLAAGLPPRATGAVVAGLPVSAIGSIVLRGDERYLPLLAVGAVRARREALGSLVKPVLGGFQGTMVGAVLLVNDRPVAARIFARHDLFAAALPDVLLGFAVEIRDEELALGPAAAARIRKSPAEIRSRALGWLRAAARGRGAWGESYGAGFETVFTTPGVAGHAVADQQRALVHAAFYAIPVLPAAQQGQGEPSVPPTPPDNPDETATGFRERRPRPTVEDERRSDLNPNPGPHADPAKGQGQTPDRATPPPR